MRLALYSQEDLDRLRRRNSFWTRTAAAVGLGGFAACVAMAAMTSTDNAARMELMAELTSTLCGWFVLYVAIFVISATRRDLAHAQMLQSEEPERIEGAVTFTGERVAIRKSVTAHRLEVRQGDTIRRLLAAESQADKLSGVQIRAVYAVHGYVAAYEVEP